MALRVTSLLLSFTASVLYLVKEITESFNNYFVTENNEFIITEDDLYIEVEDNTL